ncbi:hydrogenase small subunit [Desulfonauticus submarinus]|uniref:Hydrogenase small subunit n=1 Tax=Desulfonauticus submarinus TaxID=206665 RepID=A0A1H0EZR4_9BACT|nr:NiFeSe hydrogenase small subunit [Desulfonauticus submarinus]SDN87882.1 hydrogenase small subunit [Desulfonauticus submarinus]
MSLKRRDFVKLCAGTVAGLGISQVFNPSLVMALEKAAKKTPVIWIQGQGCTGCSVSLLNTVHPSIKEVLLKIISLEYHPTVMAAEGELALEHMYEIANKYKGKFFLVVEGAIPKAADGKYCIVGEMGGKEITMLELTEELGKKAAATVAVGACACFSAGIPGAEGNLTEASSVKTIFDEAGIKTPVINIPGCPPHPDWMVGTIAHVLLYGIPELDDNARPKLFYGLNIHENCPYRSYYESGTMAPVFTKKEGCRYDLGCKGPVANADCWKRHWNNGVNWCIENALCIGCVEPGFPDDMSPFYESM